MHFKMLWATLRNRGQPAKAKNREDCVGRDKLLSGNPDRIICNFYEHGCVAVLSLVVILHFVQLTIKPITVRRLAQKEKKWLE